MGIEVGQEPGGGVGGGAVLGDLDASVVDMHPGVLVDAMLLQLGVSRQREYLADATAAQLLGEGRPLADALESLERGTQAPPMPVNPAIASLYIANPLPRAGLATLFATHPPIAERVRRLREYDSSVEIGFPA